MIMMAIVLMMKLSYAENFLLNSETQSRQAVVGQSSTSGNCYCAQNVRDPQIRRRHKNGKLAFGKPWVGKTLLCFEVCLFREVFQSSFVSLLNASTLWRMLVMVFKKVMMGLLMVVMLLIVMMILMLMNMMMVSLLKSTSSGTDRLKWESTKTIGNCTKLRLFKRFYFHI